MHLTTTQLQVLEALSELRHFTKAAQRLGVTQSALSQQLKSLEKTIGLPLINRDTRPLAMTPVGEKLLVRAKLILQQVQAIERECKETEELKEGNVAFGVIPTIAPYLTQHVLPYFIAHYPGIKIDIHEDTTSNLAQKVQQGHIDLAITSDLETLPSSAVAHLEEMYLFSERLYLVSPTNPIQQEKQLPMIGLTEGHCLRGQAVTVCNKAIDDTIHCEQLATLLSLVRSGVGIAVIPSMAVPQPNDSAIQIEELPDATRLVQVITRPQKHPNPATAAFIAVVKNQLPQKH